MQKVYSLLRKNIKWRAVSLIFMAVQSNAYAAAQDSSNVSLHFTNQPIENVFIALEKQTGYTVFFSGSTLDGNTPITVKVSQVTLSNALAAVLRGKNITWTIKHKGIVLSKKPVAADVPAEPGNLVDTVPLIDVSGVVVDAKGNPIPAATVSLKGHPRGQGTDNMGRFSFTRVPGNGTLVFSSLGYDPKQVRIAGRGEIRVALDSTIREIEGVEIVSTGYQKIAKERATGSFVQISNGLYNEQVGTNVLQRLPSIASSVLALPGKLTNNQFALTIRGISSIGGPQQPLIILDNFPYEGDINNLNPNDIEDITILRDAAAASIWGTRAGNGVIVITTKKSRFNSKTKLEFTTNLTLENEPDLGYLKLFTTGDYINVEKSLFDRGYYDSNLDFNPAYYQTKVVDILEKIRKSEISQSEGDMLINALSNKDIRNEYQKYIYQKAFNQQYALNLRGGGNYLAWIIAAGYDNNKSALKANYERYNFRIDNTYKPITNLQLNVGILYSQTKNTSGADGYGSLPTTQEPPYTTFKDSNGTPVPYYTFREGFIDTLGQDKLLDWSYYPTEDYKHSYSINKIQNLIGRFGIKYNIKKYISLEANYQIEKENTTSNAIADAQSYSTRFLINQFTNIDYTTGQVTRVIPMGDILNRTESNLTSQSVRGQINFDHTAGNSSITAIAVGEIRDMKSEDWSNTLYGYSSDTRTNVLVDPTRSYDLVHPFFGSGEIPVNDNSSLHRRRYVSLFSNIIYTYKQRYSLSGSFRRDASNLFGVSTKQKWNPLWSVGGSWNIANEGFYKSDVLTVLKIRGTYGVSGNIFPGASATTTISYFSPSIHTNTPRANVLNYANADLRWEKVRMLNLGVDFSTKNSRISGSLEYFRKTSIDLYGPSAYDRTLGLGVATILKNNGTLRGNGIDLMLNSININKALKWSSSLNFSYYTDKVIEFYFTNGPSIDYLGGTPVAKGYTRFSILSYKFAGLDPETGNPLGIIGGKSSTNYSAILNDSTKLADLNYHGSATPKFYGSIGNTISFKDISLSFRITYQLGHYFYRNSVDYVGLIRFGRGHSDYVQRWQKPGDEKHTSVPSMPPSINSDREFFYTYSEPLVTKADHVRLEYVNLTYNIANKKATFLPFSNLRLSLIANNVGLLWKTNNFGIDPLYTDFYALPPSRNFTASANVTF